MKKTLLATMFAMALTFSAVAGWAGDDPMVGGAAMYPTKNIVQNAMNSQDHTTLVAAVKAAGLVETLEGPGPFTVFAPTNEAFAKLPAGTVKGRMRLGLQKMRVSLFDLNPTDSAPTSPARSGDASPAQTIDRPRLTDIIRGLLGAPFRRFRFRPVAIPA